MNAADCANTLPAQAKSPAASAQTAAKATPPSRRNILSCGVKMCFCVVSAKPLSVDVSSVIVLVVALAGLHPRAAVSTPSIGPPLNESVVYLNRLVRLFWRHL